LRDALIWNQSVTAQVLGNKINGRSPARYQKTQRADEAGGLPYIRGSFGSRIIEVLHSTFARFLLSLP